MISQIVQYFHKEETIYANKYITVKIWYKKQITNLWNEILQMFEIKNLQLTEIKNYK